MEEVRKRFLLQMDVRKRGNLEIRPRLWEKRLCTSIEDRGSFK